MEDYFNTQSMMEEITRDHSDDPSGEFIYCLENLKGLQMFSENRLDDGMIWNWCVDGRIMSNDVWVVNTKYLVTIIDGVPTVKFRYNPIEDCLIPLNKKQMDILKKHIVKAELRELREDND